MIAGLTRFTFRVVQAATGLANSSSGESSAFVSAVLGRESSGLRIFGKASGEGPEKPSVALVGNDPKLRSGETPSRSVSSPLIGGLAGLRLLGELDGA